MVAMDLSAALSFVGDHRNGVLVTQKRDGRPQRSNIIDPSDELVALYRAMLAS